MVTNAYQKYKNTQIETANQEKLLIMMYNGAIKFSKQAKEAINRNDYEAVNNSLVRTQDILLELQATLDHKKGGEIAENLDALYDYMKRRLTDANVDKEKEPIDEVIDMLNELKETWVEASKKIKKKNNTGNKRISVKS
mgnify:FL=1